MSPQQELFSNPDYVKAEILEIRKQIGSTNATEKTFNCAFVALGMMLFYAPEDLIPSVEAQLYETNQRHLYFQFKPKKGE